MRNIIRNIEEQLKTVEQALAVIRHELNHAKAAAIRRETDEALTACEQKQAAHILQRIAEDSEVNWPSLPGKMLRKAFEGKVIEELKRGKLNAEDIYGMLKTKLDT